MNGNLVLQRKEGQWTVFKEKKTGTTFRIKTQKTRNGSVDLVIEDKDFNYLVERPERNAKV